MSIEVQIENRLKDTKSILIICTEDHGRIGRIRKGAMRGGIVSDEDMKWMVRTLTDVLAFKLNVLELWIEDDTKTLETGYQEGAKTEPQLKVKTQQDVAEATSEGHTGVLEEAPLEDIKEETEKQEDEEEMTPMLGGVPEPALEGMDRIKELLN